MVVVCAALKLMQDRIVSIKALALHFGLKTLVYRPLKFTGILALLLTKHLWTKLLNYKSLIFHLSRLNASNWRNKVTFSMCDRNGNFWIVNSLRLVVFCRAVFFFHRNPYIWLSTTKCFSSSCFCAVSNQEINSKNNQQIFFFRLFFICLL